MTVDSQELTLPNHPTLLHPRTGEPLRAVGIVAGRPVWPVIGGDGSEGDANDGNDEGGDNDDQDDNDQDAGNDDQDGDGQDDGNDNEDGRIKRANKDAAKYRKQAREAQQQAQQTQGILDRLRAAITGDDSGSGDVDPAELAGQVENLTSETANLQRQLLVHELAPANGADPNALLDSRSFLSTLQELDSEDDDYRDEVARAIKNAAKKNAAYRAGQGSDQGGTELDASQREKRGKKRPGSLEGAIGAALTGKK